MSWLITNFIAAFLLPPLCFLPLLVFALVYLRRRPLASRIALGVLFMLMYLCSIPYCTDAALQRWESRYPALHEPLATADAIVILGGGSNFHAPEYGGLDTVSHATLQRIRYGAVLQRQTHLPLLVSGGTPHGNQSGEATQMQAVLEQELRVPVRWVEANSDNTDQNARNSYAILHPLGFEQIYLVTHASHMSRAVRAFEQAGFTVIAAPTAFTTSDPISVMSFVPQARALLDSKIFIHELIGSLWYRIKSAIN